MRKCFRSVGASVLRSRDAHHATPTGPGVAVRVVVVPKEKVDDAPLGEPFRVLEKEDAQQVC